MTFKVIERGRAPYVVDVPTWPSRGDTLMIEGRALIVLAIRKGIIYGQ